MYSNLSETRATKISCNDSGHPSFEGTPPSIFDGHALTCSPRALENKLSPQADSKERILASLKTQSSMLDDALEHTRPPKTCWIHSFHKMCLTELTPDNYPNIIKTLPQDFLALDLPSLESCADEETPPSLSSSSLEDKQNRQSSNFSIDTPVAFLDEFFPRDKKLHKEIGVCIANIQSLFFNTTEGSRLVVSPLCKDNTNSDCKRQALSLFKKVFRNLEVTKGQKSCSELHLDLKMQVLHHVRHELTVLAGDEYIFSSVSICFLDLLKKTIDSCIERKNDKRSLNTKNLQSTFNSINTKVNALLHEEYMLLSRNETTCEPSLNIEDENIEDERKTTDADRKKPTLPPARLIDTKGKILTATEFACVLATALSFFFLPLAVSLVLLSAVFIIGIRLAVYFWKNHSHERDPGAIRYARPTPSPRQARTTAIRSTL